MTSLRIAGRRRGRPILPSAAPLLAIALLAAACGGTGPSAVPASPALASPAGSAGPSGSGGSAAPRPTSWPGNAVIGIEALGVADPEITAAISDLGRGIQTEDLALIRKAADGLSKLDVLLPNLDKISIYEPMVPFAERYGDAVRAISPAATDVRSAIDAGDAAAITSSTQALVAALGLYTDVQPELAQWVHDSIEQRRLLLR
jgi:hypothetical protein